MDEKYLYATPRTRWAISRWIDGRWISLVQDSHLDSPLDAEAVLRALNIAPTEWNLNLYFPIEEGQGRCPTLDLLERCNVLDPTNPVFKKRKGEAGV